MKRLALVATLFIAPLLHGEGRHALILCNQNYRTVGVLKTPLAEAKAAEATLTTLGFQGNITVITDATTAQMMEAVDTFAAKLGQSDVALFFYGGHAIQAAGENYLLGVDSDPATSSQLAYKALPLGRVLTNLEGSGARLNLLILDCCRDNPLPTRGRNVGGTRGLAPLANAPRGTFIAYAADANQQAWDDHGTTGLYGSVLFEKMKTPGLRLEDIFIETREDVARIAREKYDHQQEPAEYSKVSGSFYFVQREEAPRPAAPAPVPAAVSSPSDPFAGIFPGQSWENSTGTAFRWCPPGEFWMGSSEEEKKAFNRDGLVTDEETRHQVRLTKGFWMSQNEVTQGEWEAVMGTSLKEQAKKMLEDEALYWNDGKRTLLRDLYGAKRTDNPENHFAIKSPHIAMYLVNWHEAEEYCRKLTERERSKGKIPSNWGFSLPTEAQWEHACRAGTETPVYNGDINIVGKNNAPILDGIGWYGGNSSQGYNGPGINTKPWPEKQYPGGDAGPRRVGQKKPNAWGLYDMIGNVREWCKDGIGTYAWLPSSDPVLENIPGLNLLANDAVWEDAKTLNDVAWALATTPAATQRMGEDAVKAARKAMSLLPKEHTILDTFAATLARAGLFDEAVQQQRQAVKDAPEAYKPEYRERLKLYEAKKAFADVVGLSRIVRGGSWWDPAACCRSACRDGKAPGFRDAALGFRPALVPSER